MRISAVNGYQTNFKQNYENPINRKTEKGLTVLASVGSSAIVGSIAAGLTTCAAKGWKLPAGVGALAAAVTLLLTLPKKLYDTKVNAFAKEKEMDVFSRDRDAKSNMLEQINEQVKDENVSLKEKVDNYTKVQMANNGKGVLLQGS